MTKIITFRVELMSDIRTDETFVPQLLDEDVIEIHPTLPSEDISHPLVAHNSVLFLFGQQIKQISDVMSVSVNLSLILSLKTKSDIQVINEII